MANDNTSDICDNDIIVAFEIRNNCNPLAIYLEYQGKGELGISLYHSILVDLSGPGAPRREPFTHPFIINAPMNYKGARSI